MIRVEPGVYRLSDSVFVRLIDGQWWATDAGGAKLHGPYGDPLEVAWGPRLEAAMRARRATIRARTITTPNTRVRGGIVVRVKSPAGQLLPASGLVRKLHPAAGPYRWQVGMRTGDSPLCIAAVIAVAHIIDESEAPL